MPHIAHTKRLDVRSSVSIPSPGGTLETTGVKAEPQSELDYSSSLAKLRSTNLGRIAVNGEKCPDVFPVRYAIDGVAIVFRACPTVQTAIGGNRSITFQADGWDDASDAAWSVSAQGAVEEMRNLGRLETPVGFMSTDDEAWARSEDSKWVRMVPQVIVGITSANQIVDVRR